MLGMSARILGGTTMYSTKQIREVAEAAGYEYTVGNGTDILTHPQNVTLIRDGIGWMIFIRNPGYESTYQTTVCSGLDNAIIVARKYLRK